MHWDYRVALAVAKKAEQFPSRDKDKIFGVLEDMKGDPFAGDVKKIRGEENLYRRRVGSYRIYFRPLWGEKVFDILEISRKQSH